MKESVLQQIGLTRSEIAVYTALLELGSSSTGKIVDKSKASSSKIYEILDRLMQKGLVSFIIKSGVKYFEASPPQRIMDYMKEKEAKFNKQKEDIKKLIPELELKQTLSKYKSEATVYKGMKGVHTAFYSSLDFLKKGDELLVLGVPHRTEQLNRFFIKYAKEMNRRGIKERIIFSEQARNDPQAQPENRPLSNIRFIPEKTPAAINIFKDRVLIFPESEELLLVSIDSKEIADSFRAQFERFWNQDILTYQGQEGVEKAYNSLLDTVKPDDEMMIFASKPKTKRGAEFNVEWNKQMKKLLKRIRLLYYGYDEKNKNRIKEFEEVGCDTKIIPTDQTNPISTVVAGDIIINSVWGKDPLTFKIKNKTVADSLRTNFELLWGQDTTVTKGIKAIDSALKSYLDNLQEGETYNVLGVTFGEKDSFYDKKEYRVLFENIHTERVKRGIKARLLFRQRPKKIIDKFMKQIYNKNSEAKILPYKTDFPVAILPSQNQTLFIIQEKEPTLITISNKVASQAFQDHFEAMWRQDTRIVRGLDAVQDLFEEILEAGSCDLIGARGYFFDARPQYIDEWEQRAIKAGFKMRNIVDSETKGHKITRLPFVQTKYSIPKEYSKLSVFWVYGNKVVITNFTEKEPIAVIIENKRLHDMYEQQFDLLWNQEVAVTRGIDAAQAAWDTMLDELKPGEEYCVLGASWKGQKQYIPDYFADFHKKRQEKGVKVKFLFCSGTEEMLEKYKPSYYDKLSQIKFLPPGAAYEGMQVNLYHNKVLMFVWREKEPVVFTIEDKKVFNTFKAYFETLWSQDAHVSRGFEAFEKEWYSLFDKLKPGESYGVFGAAFGVQENEERFANFFKKFHTERIKRGIKSKILFQKGAEKTVKKYGLDELYSKDLEYKQLPFKRKFPVEIFPCKDTTLMLIQEKEPITVTIKNKEITESFTNFFDTLWNQEVDTYKDDQGIKTAFTNLVDELNEGEEVHIMGVYDFGEDFLRLALSFHEIRSKKGIKAKFLINKSAKNIAEKFQQYPPVEIKFMPDKLFTPAIFIIYNDKVIINLAKEKTFFVMQSENASKAFEAYFQLMWKQNKKD